MKKGVLVRVGIDKTSGYWNAPCDPVTGKFVYVPIPEENEHLHPELIRDYREILPFLTEMGVALPLHLKTMPMHLDPDFWNLTYGDVYPRSKPILNLQTGDFLVFYSSFRSIHPHDRQLIYALTGIYFIKEVVKAGDIPEDRWQENAHTRRCKHDRDVVVRAIPEKSGRFTRVLPVGELRDRQYWVKKSILDEWGGLTTKDGWLVRSARLPEFKEPERFLKWFDLHKVDLVRKNN